MPDAGLLQLFLLFRGTLKARIAAACKFALKLLDPTRRIDVFQLAGVERMAAAADINLQLFSRTSRLERITTPAGHRRFNILRMNVFLHFR